MAYTSEFLFFLHKTKIWDTSRYIFYNKIFSWWLRALRAKKLIYCKNYKIAFSACSACTFCKIFKFWIFYDISSSEFDFLGIWTSIGFFPCRSLLAPTSKICTQTGVLDAFLSNFMFFLKISWLQNELQKLVFIFSSKKNWIREMYLCTRLIFCVHCVQKNWKNSKNRFFKK